MRSNIYTAVLEDACAPGGGVSGCVFDLVLRNKDYILKKLIFDIFFYDNLLNIPIPLEQNTTQFFHLTVINNNTPIAKAVNPIVGPGIIFDTGLQIQLFRPQTIYPNLFINIDTRVTFANINQDPLVPVTYRATLLFEVEET